MSLWVRPTVWLREDRERRSLELEERKTIITSKKRECAIIREWRTVWW